MEETILNSVADAVEDTILTEEINSSNNSIEDVSVNEEEKNNMEGIRNWMSSYIDKMENESFYDGSAFYVVRHKNPLFDNFGQSKGPKLNSTTLTKYTEGLVKAYPKAEGIVVFRNELEWELERLKHLRDVRKTINDTQTNRLAELENTLIPEYKKNLEERFSAMRNSMLNLTNPPKEEEEVSAEKIEEKNEVEVTEIENA